MLGGDGSSPGSDRRTDPCYHNMAFVLPIVGLATAAVVGALKEIIWDWLLKKGTLEFLDFVVTVADRVLGP